MKYFKCSFKDISRAEKYALFTKDANDVKHKIVFRNDKCVESTMSRLIRKPLNVGVDVWALWEKKTTVEVFEKTWSIFIA